jgi:hypothetical protein
MKKKGFFFKITNYKKANTVVRVCVIKENILIRNDSKRAKLKSWNLF